MNGGQGNGIDVKDENSLLSVKYNTVFGNAVKGITSLSPSVYEGNVVYSNGNGGIDLDSYWGNTWTEDIIIRNNVIYGNNDRGISILESNKIINSPTYIYNNSLRDNGNSSYPENIRVIGVSSLTLQNNVTMGTNNGNGPEVYVSGVPSVSADYNDFYGNISGFTRGPNGLNIDPLFQGVEELRPQKSSPLVDYGVSVPGFFVDILGTPRPQKGAWDVEHMSIKRSHPSRHKTSE